MGAPIYLTRFSMDGPWLIDAKALGELDSIIAKHWPLLERGREKSLEKAVKEESVVILKQVNSSEEYLDRIELFEKNHPKYSRRIRQVTIEYDDFKFRCESFEGAFQEISITSNVPIGFTYYVSSGDVDCTITVKDGSGLEVFVVPEGNDQAKNLYTELGNWARKYRAPRWQIWWEKLAKTGFRFYIFLAGLAFTLSFISEIIKLNSSYLDAQARAQKILDTGLNNNNLHDAIELLLETQVMSRFSVQFYSLLLVIIGIIIFAIIFTVRPRVVIGVGKGNDRIHLWRGWLKFVGTAVPGFVLTFIILPRIANWITSLLKIP